MSDARVWVVLGPNGTAIEILKNEKHAAHTVGVPVAYKPRSEATSQIRNAVYLRDGKACAHCGTPVTPRTMHLHERHWRGRGGEISVANSVTVCHNCHMNDPVAGHGNRKVQWTVANGKM